MVAQDNKSLLLSKLFYRVNKDRLHQSAVDGGIYSFLSRHPELNVHTAECLSYSRAVAQDQTILDKYFDLLEQSLLAKELINSPSCIVSVDGSGFPRQQRSQT